MSRSLTAAQIIGLGEYLNPNFDPASLTVSQLLGVLGFHNIQYPTPYTKPKLVQLFTDEITLKSAKLRRDRQKKDQSLASNDGIMDGVTGRPIGKEKLPARRSSRRSSRANSEDETTIDQPEPPKRRRSSAAPNLGGTSSRRTAPSEPVLVEESEPEDDDEIVVRKVGRSKKSSVAAGAQARRISTADDSGWEDRNIFQSGAESSSPVRASPPKAKILRKNTATRKSRKSMSAPPQSSPSSSPPKAPQFAERLMQAQQSPTFKFEPSLPPSFSREARAAASRPKRSSIVPPVESSPLFEPVKDHDSGDDELDVIGDDIAADDFDAAVATNDSFEDEHVEEEDDDQTVAVSRRIAEGPVALAKPRKQSTPWYLRALIAVVGVAGSAGVYTYKSESAPIGYCDTGKNTNSALEALNAKWDAIESCNRENRTFLQFPGSSDSSREDDEPMLCPPPALIPFLHSTHCTPCPEHAFCVKDTVKCENGYLLRPHPVLSLLSPFGSVNTPAALAVQKVITSATNGLPGLGPVALPQRCVEDPMRKRNIGVLGKVIESLLGQERGMRLCAGKGTETFVTKDGGEARNWGMEMGELAEVMKKKTPPQLLPTFDDTFNEAVQQLLQWGGVILGEDSAGKRYLAVKEPNLTWNCAITVKSREAWNEWRATVLGLAALVVSGVVARGRNASRAVENKRVAELVQIALDTLRNQELAHHTDPVTAPQPYLSSLQLRDLILQGEHSISSRRRLWDQVERVVEGNANVRANLEEVHGGDELRVWRWVGSTGRSPGARKRVQFDDSGEDE